jgi:hypothetical protein
MQNVATCGQTKKRDEHSIRGLNRRRRGSAAERICIAVVLSAGIVGLASWASAQQAVQPDQSFAPGEAYVTRFSGVVSGADGKPTINVNGVVGGVIDVRAPGAPPAGEHWINEPQHTQVTAGEVGQVFGVALDDATPPNVYLTASAAFGLHLAPGGDWMQGQWGSGGSGAVYKLDAQSGYRPQLFATITLDGRPNSGAALGNIAYDRAHKQLFVSDLETGMIHRVGLDGKLIDRYDHGVTGRAAFLDATSRQRGSLPPIAFAPESRARMADCAQGPFERTPACWNVAASGRRVWGLGVYQNPVLQQQRLYYAVWSGPDFDSAAWNAATDDDKRNAVWSVKIAPDGSFDSSDVRREFLLPDAFVKPQDIARAGYSRPVSDITFSQCGPRPIMLVAERGGMRNLGLSALAPFAFPHEARALRYELDQNGAWRVVGRYDVGYYDRKAEGQPFIRANCEGGVAFGLGYNAQWIADPAKPDDFVWISGHSLCSPEAPCHLPASAQSSQAPVEPASTSPTGAQSLKLDDSQVHGIQGMNERAFDELLPPAALQPYPLSGEPYPPANLDQSYLIDTDRNIDESGNLIEAELTRDDSTKIGDIAIYAPCAVRAPGTPAAIYLLPPPPLEDQPPPIIVGHDPAATHAMIASHGTLTSHYRWGSHNLYWSHNRFRSHNPYWSHNRLGSHSLFWSHNRLRSHTRLLSHDRSQSHSAASSHFRFGSHNQEWSHNRFRSHDPRRSGGHLPAGSHDAALSHQRTGSHLAAVSRAQGHQPAGSHTVAMSLANTHRPPGSHTAATSRAQTHQPAGSHTAAISRAQTHRPAGSHSATISHAQAHRPVGSHSAAISRAQTHRPTGSHSTAISRAKVGPPDSAHGPGGVVGHRPQGSHSAAISHSRFHAPGAQRPAISTPAPTIRSGPSRLERGRDLHSQ